MKICPECGNEYKLTAQTQKRCPGCAAILQRERNREKWQKQKESHEYRTYLHDRKMHYREMARAKYQCQASYRVIGGPEVISDFIDFRSLFTVNDVRNGIAAGWLPENTILEKDGVKFIIEEGKKVRL